MRKLIMTAALVLLAQNGFAAGPWGYVGDAGPSTWGKNYPACNDRQQSPINIFRPVSDAKNKIAFHYQSAEFKLNLDPHNLYALPVEPDANFVEYNGKQYQLQSFHFHVPAEHQVRGKTFPMELHMVHEDSQGDTLVVGVLLQVGDANENIDDIYVSPLKLKKTQMTTNLSKILPASKEFFEYPGSLTTPPCTEGLTWIVMEKPMQVSQKQIDYFKNHVISNNSRPLQALNGRVVEESKD
jgi:carbonic anhydrase